MTQNGQVSDDFTVEVEDGPKRYLPTLLTPEDMDRARVELADVLGDRSAYDMLEDDYDRVPFTIWCLESRNKPFTWQQAKRTPYLGEWKDGPAGPPPTAAPPAGGARNGAQGSSRKRSGPAAAPSSASSTA
jgi:hypothetical protein